jgi:hypothetical protein
MNKLRKLSFVFAIAAALVFLAGPASGQNHKRDSSSKTTGPKTQATPPKTSASRTSSPKTTAPKISSGDEFFVVSSVDRAHSVLVLLTPKQIASTFQVTDKTQYFDEKGKALKLADLRAGDTLFVNYQTKPDGTFAVERVRKGMMTVEELRRRYSPGLPVNAGTSATKTR